MLNPTIEQMNSIMSLDAELVKVEIRAEGCVNSDWKFTLKNNTIECYAIEGSPRFYGTDERVYNVYPIFDQFLENLLDEVMDFAPSNFDETSDTVDFELLCINNRLIVNNVTHESP